MKDIFTIILRLTISCLLAGVVMGITFIFTHNAKKHNAHQREQKVSQSLLGYSANNPPPATMAMHEIYRYIVATNATQNMGYLLQGSSDQEGFIFIVIDLDGKFVSQTQVTLATDKAAEEDARTQAIATALGPGTGLRFADQTIVVTNDGKRTAYLLPGKFPGFKTFIGVMLALDQNFTIIGLEVLEHEEDPGLGAEIVQKYFKDQFKGKT
ncbi:MAG: FMN-binding protein, partial [Desulfobulbaceae bacterium]|nr:FMN-binding protein [Desulfobulbaceae bacterium]